MIAKLRYQTTGKVDFDKWSYNNVGLSFSLEQNPYFNATNPNLINSSDGVNKTFYTYGPLARVTKVIGPDGTAIVIDFNHWVITAYDQNNHRKQYLLDAYNRIKNVVEYNWDDIVRKDEVYNTSYTYDTTDNLVYINDSLGNEFRFRYDSLGRKIQLEDPDIGTYTYKYDLAGNLIQQNGGGGNLITGDGYYREYNELNQLISVRNGSNSTGNILEEHTYDPNGDRIKIKRFDAANTTIYTPYREWTQIRNSSGTYDFTYIYDGSILVARINPDGSKHYFHDDHLGSVSLITNQSGAIIEQTFFEPFGSVMAGGTAEDKLYTGQFSDDLTGQYYYGARYYLVNPPIFISADPIIQQVYDPQFLNHYSYARNNPYKLIDVDGREVYAILQDTNILGVNTGHIEFVVKDPTQGGYRFYSNKGPNSDNSKYVTYAKSLFGAYKSEYKTVPENAESPGVSKPEAFPKSYRDCFCIETTEDQDRQIIDKANEIVSNPETYWPRSDNSQDFVIDSLSAGEIDIERKFLPKNTFEEAKKNLIDNYKNLNSNQRNVDKTKSGNSGSGGGSGGSSKLKCYQTCTSSCTVQGKCTTSCKTRCTI